MRRAVVLAALLAAGCAQRSEPRNETTAAESAGAEAMSPTATGGGAEPAVVMDDALLEDRQAADEQLARLLEAEELLSLAMDDGCNGACEAGARICDLADRICALAARHPGDPELDGRCADGGARCARVDERLATACSCGPRD